MPFRKTALGGGIHFVYSATAAAGTSTVYVTVADPAVFLDLGTGGAGALETTFSVAAGDVIAAPCFAAGTRILTRRGERAVETLRPGERVITPPAARAASSGLAIAMSNAADTPTRKRCGRCVSAP